MRGRASRPVDQALPPKGPMTLGMFPRVWHKAGTKQRVASLGMIATKGCQPPVSVFQVVCVCVCILDLTSQ